MTRSRANQHTSSLNSQQTGKNTFGFLDDTIQSDKKPLQATSWLNKEQKADLIKYKKNKDIQTNLSLFFMEKKF